MYIFVTVLSNLESTHGRYDQQSDITLGFPVVT